MILIMISHPHRILEAQLRIPDSCDAEIAKICSLWTFWPVIQLTNHLSKIRHPMLHRCKKCSDILKVASVGAGDCTFYIYGALG